MAAPLIHIWIPDYESAMGGIQVFSNFFIRAVGDCLPDARLVVFSKNDSSFPALPPHNPRTEFRCAGWWPASYRTAAFSLQLFGHALRDRPDLILSTHVNFTPVAHWLKRLTGVRYSAVGHGVDVWCLQDSALCRALRAADRVLAVSHFTRDRMQAELRLEPSRLGILPNTFNDSEFTISKKPHYLLKRFGLQPDQPVILTVARLAGAERYKGYDQILRALPAVRRAIPGVRYILGGRGADRPRVESLIRELKLEDVVTLAGYIPDHELRDFYNLCDVFSMPSKGEGFGIVYLEALASGKPVIAGNQDGSVDALLNGEVGMLIDPDNVAQLETALTLVLAGEHPLTILREPRRLRERIIEAYGYPHFAATMATHLQALGLPARAPVAEGTTASA